MKKLYSVIALAIATLTAQTAIAADDVTFAWWNSGSNDVTIQSYPVSFAVNTDNTGLAVSYTGTIWGNYSGDYGLGYTVTSNGVTTSYDLTNTFNAGDTVDLGVFSAGDVVAVYLEGMSYTTMDSATSTSATVQFHQDNAWGIKATVTGYKSSPQGQPLPGVLATMFAFGALFPVLRKKFGK